MCFLQNSLCSKSDYFLWILYQGDPGSSAAGIKVMEF